MSRKNELFSSEKESLIIQMVKLRPLLWDTTITEYRRTDLKRQHWDEIAAALGPQYSGELVRKRFQNMESTFRANERKIRESKQRCSGMGATDLFTPKWEHFTELLFLRKTCVQAKSVDTFDLSSSASRQTTSNSTEQSVYLTMPTMYFDETLQQHVEIPQDTDPSFNDAHCLQSPAGSESTSQPQSPAQSGSPLIYPPSSSASSTSGGLATPPFSAPAPGKRPSDQGLLYSKRGIKDRKKSSVVDQVVEIAKSMTKDEGPPKLDHFDMLGSYIASKLRAMTPEDFEYYENRLLEVLLEKRRN